MGNKNATSIPALHSHTRPVRLQPRPSAQGRGAGSAYSLKAPKMALMNLSDLSEDDKQNVILYLMKNRHVDAKTGCWVWRPLKSKKTPRHTYARRSNLYIHRLSAYLFLGPSPSPEKIWVCHKCDNPPCFNPNHLFWATPSENTLDSVQKGRFTRNRNPESRTHCRHGHELTPDNMRMYRGNKVCKICESVKSHKSYMKRKVAGLLKRRPRKEVR
jgi:hypothetical protein